MAEQQRNKTKMMIIKRITEKDKKKRSNWIVSEMKVESNKNLMVLNWCCCWWWWC